MESPGAGVKEIEMLRRQERVCAALVEECAAAGGLHRHDIGVGRGRAGGDGQLCGVDVMGAAVVADEAAAGVVTHEADGLERKLRSEPGEVLKDVVGRAPISPRLAEDVRERVLRRPGVDDLHVVDDPVSAGDEAAACGASGRIGGRRFHGDSAASMQAM